LFCMCHPKAIKTPQLKTEADWASPWLSDLRLCDCKINNFSGSYI
jgi:hypothetical protein